MTSYTTDHVAELHGELRSVAGDRLAKGSPPWAQVAELGWIGLEVAEQHGGAGATFAEVAVVLEELGRAADPGPYLGSAVLAVGALGAVAGGPDRDALLAEVVSGGRRLAVALGRTADQPVVDPAFRLEPDGTGQVLVGRADGVIDGPGADGVLLLAIHPDGRPRLVHLEASALGVVEQPVVDATRRFAVVSADRVPVPASAVWSLGTGPATAAQRVLDRGALAVAIDSLGVAGAMLDATVAYVSDRRQFGRPIGSFQAVKHQCADAFVQLAIGRQLVDLAVAAVVDPAADQTAAVARAASYCSQVGVDVAGMAMQLHGGIGYSWEGGIHVHLKRATLDRSLFGSPMAQRRRLAACLVAPPTGREVSRR